MSLGAMVPSWVAGEGTVGISQDVVGGFYMLKLLLISLSALTRPLI